jgi:ABC-type transport system substrate-binding protein
VGFVVRQLYIRQALQEVFDQPGIIKAVYRGYAIPTSGPAPNAPPLHGVTFSPPFTLLPEYWYFTR